MAATLRVIEGEDEKPIAGVDLMGEIVALLDAKLPLLRTDDPCLAHLRDLQHVFEMRRLRPRRGRSW